MQSTVVVGVVCRHPDETASNIQDFNEKLNELMLYLNNNNKKHFFV